MKILALDIATRTGWACGAVGGEPRWGLATFLHSDVGAFASAYDHWLSDMITVEQPDLLVFEAPILPRQTTIATARKLMGLAFLTELIAFRRSLACREVSIQTVKKFFAGHGHAPKAEMINAARRQGWNVKDDNEADALGVWAIAAHARGRSLERYVTLDELKI